MRDLLADVARSLRRRPVRIAAQRLANGNTMVVDRSGVHEIDRSGKEVSLIPTPRLSRAYRY